VFNRILIYIHNLNQVVKSFPTSQHAPQDLKRYCSWLGLRKLLWAGTLQKGHREAKDWGTWSTRSICLQLIAYLGPCATNLSNKLCINSIDSINFTGFSSYSGNFGFLWEVENCRTRICLYWMFLSGNYCIDSMHRIFIENSRLFVRSLYERTNSLILYYYSDVTTLNQRTYYVGLKTASILLH
jgi:hypothetical protein